MFNSDELRAQVKEAEVNSGGYEKVPYGVYEVAIENMELTLSKSNKPMVKVCFKIVSQKEHGRLIFYNQLVDTGAKINIFSQFLKSLKTNEKIVFEDLNQYAELIKKVLNSTDILKLEYQLNYGVNKNGYDTYKIEEVFQCE